MGGDHKAELLWHSLQHVFFVLAKIQFFSCFESHRWIWKRVFTQFQFGDPIIYGNDFLARKYFAKFTVQTTGSSVINVFINKVYYTNVLIEIGTNRSNNFINEWITIIKDKAYSKIIPWKCDAKVLKSLFAGYKMIKIRML